MPRGIHEAAPHSYFLSVAMDPTQAQGVCVLASVVPCLTSLASWRRSAKLFLNVRSSLGDGAASRDDPGNVREGTIFILYKIYVSRVVTASTFAILPTSPTHGDGRGPREYVRARVI